MKLIFLETADKLRMLYDCEPLGLFGFTAETPIDSNGHGQGFGWMLQMMDKAFESALQQKFDGKELENNYYLTGVQIVEAGGIGHPSYNRPSYRVTGDLWTTVYTWRDMVSRYPR